MSDARTCQMTRKWLQWPFDHSGSLSQGCTRQVINTFSSKEDLIDACLTSVHFPPVVPLVLWCFVLNPHRRPRYPKLLWCDKGKLRMSSPANRQAPPPVFRWCSKATTRFGSRNTSTTHPCETLSLLNRNLFVSGRGWLDGDMA